MKLNFKPSNQGFTLIELLVVIVIIGILATLATVGLNSVRAKARDSKRISDIRQMQSALELYMNDNNTYPTNGGFIIGSPLTSPDGTRTYMSKIPSNPKPWAEGACVGFGAEYTYNYINANSYQIGYCLANKVNDLSAGIAQARPGNINDACTPNCSGKYCGNNDGCGGVCNVSSFNQNADSCASGVPKCGGAAVCAGTTDTCTGGTCKCGASAACTGGKSCSAGACYNSCPTTGASITYSDVVYPTVWIDIDSDGVEDSGECWFGKNLNVGTRGNACTNGACTVGTNCNSGSGCSASNVPTDTVMPDVNNATSTIEKWCFNDLDSSCATYGGLYSWTEAMALSSTCQGSITGACAPATYLTGSGVSAKRQGICPSGWHIPSDYEWGMMTRKVDGAIAAPVNPGTGSCAATDHSFYADKICNNTSAGYGGIGSGSETNFVAGGTSTLNFSMTGSAFDAGYRYSYTGGYYWTSSRYDSQNAWMRKWASGSGTTRSYAINQDSIHGFFVRCVKD